MRNSDQQYKTKQTENMQNLNLVLHAGGNRVDVSKIGAVVTPPTTQSYHPISHRLLYDLVVGSLQTMNMRVVTEQHALARDGARYFGFDLGSLYGWREWLGK